MGKVANQEFGETRYSIPNGSIVLPRYLWVQKAQTKSILLQYNHLK